MHSTYGPAEVYNWTLKIHYVPRSMHGRPIGYEDGIHMHRICVFCSCPRRKMSALLNLNVIECCNNAEYNILVIIQSAIKSDNV